MPLRCPNQSPRTLFFPTDLFSFSKLQSVSKMTSMPNFQGEDGAAESVWFVKVVCTLFVRYKSSMKVVFLDYLRKNLDSPSASTVIKHMNCNWNNPKLALRFFEFSKVELNLVHSMDTYNFLLRSFCQVGLHDLAKPVIDHMRIDGMLPDGSLLGFVVTSFANAGKFEVGKGMLVDYSGYSGEKEGVMKGVVFNNLLNSLVKRNQVDEAVAFFENTILRSQCYCPDTYTFNIVINGLCRAGDVDKALVIFNQMRTFGCLPDLITYNTLSNGFIRGGNVDEAHKLLREISLVDWCSPDVVTYTSVISGYCKLGMIKEAVVLFEEMIGHGIRPNTVTFNVIIDGFGKMGDMVSVSKMYEKMLDLGCTPDVITFTSIIDGHCRLGESNQGLKILDEMYRRNLHPNLYTFSVLIHSLCKENGLNEARDLLRQLKMRGDIVPKAFVYNPVIDCFCKAGNVDEANLIVKEMEENRCNPDKLTFTILIIGHCMKGRMYEAISIFQKMLDVGCEPDSVTVNSLISRLLKAGMPKDAYEIRKVVSSMSFPQRTISSRPNMDIPLAV